MDWKGRVGSSFIAAVGAIMLMDGFKADMDWAAFGDVLFMPMPMLGLALIIYRAAMGTGQMKVPEIKKLGKKP